MRYIYNRPNSNHGNMQCLHVVKQMPSHAILFVHLGSANLIPSRQPLARKPEKNLRVSLGHDRVICQNRRVSRQRKPELFGGFNFSRPHKHDKKVLKRPGFEPGTLRLLFQRLIHFCSSPTSYPILF